VKLSRLLTALILSTAGIPVAPVGAAAGQADPGTAADPAVITEWNAITARTVFTENAVPVPASGLYFGFVAIAVYDAVVAIEGGFTPYAKQSRAHRKAFPEVAAATAAHRVLSTYFPSSAASLAADYATSLADIPDGVGKAQGKRVGEAAAAALIGSRQHDGRDATVPLTVRPQPGAWRPTPDAFAPMLVPWLGFVKPLVLRSPTQIALGGPDAIGSAAYAKDFTEVKTYGAKEGSSRTAEQTRTALFWNANSVLQYQVALRDQVTRRGLDILHSSRAFVLLDTATADALIACWRAKYDNAYWRPVTAIREADTDGNDATEPDAGWAPLVPTPPYPDYTSGHACITGAASSTFGYLFGATTLNLDVFSSVTATSRHYERVDVLDTETMNARIWLGLHFREAMTDGNHLGHRVAEWSQEHFFRSTCSDWRGQVAN
jgi:hypothetical protein